MWGWPKTFHDIIRPSAGTYEKNMARGFAVMEDWAGMRTPHTGFKAAVQEYCKMRGIAYHDDMIVPVYTCDNGSGPLKVCCERREATCHHFEDINDRMDAETKNMVDNLTDALP